MADGVTPSRSPTPDDAWIDPRLKGWVLGDPEDVAVLLSAHAQAVLGSMPNGSPRRFSVAVVDVSAPGGEAEDPRSRIPFDVPPIRRFASASCGRAGRVCRLRGWKDPLGGVRRRDFSDRASARTLLVDSVRTRVAGVWLALMLYLEFSAAVRKDKRAVRASRQSRRALGCDARRAVAALIGCVHARRPLSARAAIQSRAGTSAAQTGHDR